MEKSLDPSKVLGLEILEENENEEIFSFSTVNHYKTNVQNLKESVMKLQKTNAQLKFQSEGNYFSGSTNYF